MRLMTPSEFMCISVVCRKTIGWQKAIDEISLSLLQEYTGLTRKTVVKSVKNLEKKGYIWRSQNSSMVNGKQVFSSTSYALRFQDDPYTYEENNQGRGGRVKNTLPPNQEGSGKNTLGVVEKIHLQKKELKNNKQHVGAVVENKLSEAEQEACDALVVFGVLDKQSVQIVQDENWTPEEIQDLISYVRSQKKISNPAGLLMKMYRDGSKAPKSSDTKKNSSSSANGEIVENQAVLEAQRAELKAQQEAEEQARRKTITQIYSHYGTADEQVELEKDLETAISIGGRSLERLLAGSLLVSKKADTAVLVMPNNFAIQNLERQFNKGALKTMLGAKNIEFVAKNTLID